LIICKCGIYSDFILDCINFSVYISNLKLPMDTECEQEDEIIIDLVNRYGPKKWSTIAQKLPGRIGKQCRERYGNWISIVLRIQ